MIERVYLDLDETTVDLCTKWSYYMNNRYGTSFTRDTVPYGRAEDQEEGNRWIDFLRIPGFMADLPFIEPSTKPTLEYLAAEGYRIVPVTRSVAWESAKDKYSWIHTHLRIPGIIKTMKDIHQTGAKGDLLPYNDELQIDSILIDDDPKNLQEFNGHVICYARPWNERFRERLESGEVWRFGVRNGRQRLEAWVESWEQIPFVIGRMNGILYDQERADVIS